MSNNPTDGWDNRNPKTLEGRASSRTLRPYQAAFFEVAPTGFGSTKGPPLEAGQFASRFATLFCVVFTIGWIYRTPGYDWEVQSLKAQDTSWEPSGSHFATLAPLPDLGEQTNPAAFLRWAGCKRKLLPQLSSHWSSKFTRYVEPFAGSSSLFFKLQPQDALLADKNADLIEVYEVLRDYPEELHARVSSMRKSKIRYYRLREQNPRRLSRLDRAVRFLYLNRYCFNGIYRTNRDGKFNVPYARSGTGGIPALEQFVACSRLLVTAQLRAWDFGTTLRNVGEGDFVYIDPPYAVQSRRVFVEYGPRWFSRQDLTRLAEHLKKIDRRGATFLVSYADCREARELSKGWHVMKLAVQRNIAGFQDDRRRAYELVISNRYLV